MYMPVIMRPLYYYNNCRKLGFGWLEVFHHWPDWQPVKLRHLISKSHTNMILDRESFTHRQNFGFIPDSCYGKIPFTFNLTTSVVDL